MPRSARVKGRTPKGSASSRLRSGVRPVDDDGDGLFDEDGLDDLDADGHITQMRIADPNGDYKPHPDFPNMLVKVKPGEKGQYRLLGAEGIDNDGDGDTGASDLAILLAAWGNCQ